MQKRDKKLPHQGNGLEHLYTSKYKLVVLASLATCHLRFASLTIRFASLAMRFASLEIGLASLATGLQYLSEYNKPLYILNETFQPTGVHK